jgi:hypothetical protein
MVIKTKMSQMHEKIAAVENSNLRAHCIYLSDEYSSVYSELLSAP